MAHNSANHSRHHDTNAIPASFIRYRALLILLFPVLLLYTVFQTIKYRDTRYCLQRFGLRYAISSNINYWIHAASVGEVNAATPLIQALKKHNPQARILITTTTPTGAQVAGKLAGGTRESTGIEHCYLPIDYVFAVKRLLKKASPNCVLVMETEIWPNLFRICSQCEIPLVTVNGRLSPRTLHTANWIKALYRSTLQYSTLILTRSDKDTKGYIALGADPGKIKTVGNIKFAVDFKMPENDSPPFNNREYVLAASTHDDEELQIALFWKKHLESLKGYLLVIAPRHPNRIAKILGQLDGLELNIAIHSRNDAVSDKTNIYLIDTVGELVHFMNHAKLIVMGGSLVDVGGHNILEPASLSKAIIFGPSMNNFEDEAQLFLGHDGAIQAQNIDQVGEYIINLLRDNKRLKQLGNNAYNLLAKQKHVAEQYVIEIQSVMGHQ